MQKLNVSIRSIACILMAAILLAACGDSPQPRVIDITATPVATRTPNPTEVALEIIAARVDTLADMYRNGKPGTSDALATVEADIADAGCPRTRGGQVRVEIHPCTYMMPTITPVPNPTQTPYVVTREVPRPVLQTVEVPVQVVVEVPVFQTVVVHEVQQIEVKQTVEVPVEQTVVVPVAQTVVVERPVVRTVIVTATPLPYILAQSVTIHVRAQDDWHDSKFPIIKNHKYKVKVLSGTWGCKLPYNNCEDGTKGWGDHYGNPPQNGPGGLHSEFAYAALIGKIGATGVVFDAYEGGEFVAYEEGNLYFRSNVPLGAQSGTLLVEISELPTF